MGLELMLVAAMSDRGGEAAREYAQFTLGFHLPAALMVLKDDAAETLAVRFLKANHQHVRNLCGIVMARRWPGRLFKSGQGAFSEKEYAALLALIVQHHPEQSAAAAAMTPDGLAKARSDLRQFGPGASLGVAGNLLKLF